MSGQKFTRREFLKISALSLSSLAFRLWDELADDSRSLFAPRPARRAMQAMLPLEDRAEPIGVGRVTVARIGVYQQPSLKSERVGERKRDEMVSLFEEVDSPFGPPRNPRWYRVVGGYAHSAYLQRVESAHLHPPARFILSGAQLGEVTVPFAPTARWTIYDGWTPLYRLYFQSVHWIRGIDEGPDGKPWYRLTDELLRVDYHAPATHLRLIPNKELSPISPHVPWEKKRIEVSLRDQTLTAYEDGEIVLHTQVSTGLPDLTRSSPIPTVTPSGKFTIDVKMPSKHMGDGNLTAEVEAYELPGVPWVCFFAPDGIALHGTYWHDNFGSPMSHGCVNMRTEDAKWIYRWSLPPIEPREWEHRGYGTQVEVH